MVTAAQMTADRLLLIATYRQRKGAVARQRHAIKDALDALDTLLEAQGEAEDALAANLLEFGPIAYEGRLYEGTQGNPFDDEACHVRMTSIDHGDPDCGCPACVEDAAETRELGRRHLARGRTPDDSDLGRVETFP